MNIINQSNGKYSTDKYNNKIRYQYNDINNNNNRLKNSNDNQINNIKS